MTRGTLPPLDPASTDRGQAVSTILSAVVVVALGLVLCWCLCGLGS